VGTWLYYVPYHKGSGDGYAYHGYVARVNRSDFTSSGIEYLNLADVAADLIGYWGGCSDGTYVYLSPDGHGHLVRIAADDFTSNGVTVIDLVNDVQSGMTYFISPVAYAGYVYYTPRTESPAHLTRVPLNDFSASAVEYIVLTNFNQYLHSFKHLATDGVYGYLAPHPTSDTL
jgi:hypothetical protein